MNAKGARIVIWRKPTLYHSVYTWNVIIDDKEEGKINRNQKISIAVNSGEHHIYIRGRNTKDSVRVTVPIDVGQEVSMTCWAGPRRINLQVDAAPSRKVVETDQYEIPIGSREVRTIDNLQGVSPIVRTFHLSREWTRSFTMDWGRSVTEVESVGLETKAASFKMQATQTIEQHYSTSGGNRRSFEDTVVITVAPRTRSEVIFAWKEIRQRGYVEELDGTTVLLKVPFELVVGLTFDQQQIDTPAPK